MRFRYIREHWRKEALITLAETQLLLKDEKFNFEDLKKQSLYYSAKIFNIGYKIGSCYLFCRKKVESYYLGGRGRGKRRKKILLGKKIDCDKCKQEDCCIRDMTIDKISDIKEIEKQKEKVENLRVRLLNEKKEKERIERIEVLRIRAEKKEKRLKNKTENLNK